MIASNLSIVSSPKLSFKGRFLFLFFLIQWIALVICVIRGTPYFCQIVISFYWWPGWLYDLEPNSLWLFRGAFNIGAYMSEAIAAHRNLWIAAKPSLQRSLGFGRAQTLVSIVLPASRRGTVIRSAWILAIVCRKILTGFHISVRLSWLMKHNVVGVQPIALGIFTPSGLM